MTRGRVTISIFALLLILTGLAGGLFYHQISRPGPLSTPQRILVERGKGLGAIAHMLEQRGLLRDRLSFRLTARLLKADRDVRAGEFEIKPHASVLEILDELRFGDAVLRRVTIPEGLSSAQIVALLSEAEGLVGEIDRIPAEGTLLPETYYFSYGDERQTILKRMERAQLDLLALLWPDRAPDLPFSTELEAITLASIIEKETANHAEKPLVASVFVNRLRRNMRLQSDPTVIYGVTGGEPLGRPILRSELDRETPFNTYRIKGLPPHPIANPGAASIAAALHPADSDYLYFVADGKGGHAFATRLFEHNANVARWRRLLKDRATSSETVSK